MYMRGLSVNHLRKTSVTRQEYVTEVWREGDNWDSKGDFNDEDFIPRNNNYDFSAHKDLREHVEEMQTYLFTVRDEIDKVMQNLNMLSVKLT